VSSFHIKDDAEPLHHDVIIELEAMNNFRPIKRDAGFLLPLSVDECLALRHLPRFVVEVIEGLALSELVKAYRRSDLASYHPASCWCFFWCKGMRRKWSPAAHDPSLSPAQVPVAHGGQPHIEKGFEQIKSAREIAPVFLKTGTRIASLFTLFFLALLVHFSIERQLLMTMQSEGIDEPSLYPESRPYIRPPIEQILRLFCPPKRDTLLASATPAQVFESKPQPAVLQLLCIPFAPHRAPCAIPRNPRKPQKTSANRAEIAGKYAHRCTECSTSMRYPQAEFQLGEAY
jgi:hypothetical protein